MPTFSLSYDINNMYQIIVDVISSLWPIIAAGLAILMVAFLFDVINSTFRKWIDD